MKISTRSLFAAAIAATTLMASQALAQNLVTNPGFETGDLSGYTTFGNFNTGNNGVTQGNDTGGPYAGSYLLEIGNYSYQGIAGISQTISTVAGQDYTISLYYAESGDNSGGAQLFNVSWDGATVGSRDDEPPTPYELLSYNVVGTGSDVLSLSGYSNSGYNNVDNLSVVATTMVSGAPEPSTWLLMITGIGGIGLMLRRVKAALGSPVASGLQI